MTAFTESHSPAILSALALPVAGWGEFQDFYFRSLSTVLEKEV
jgi:hypothetical protein